MPKLRNNPKCYTILNYKGQVLSISMQVTASIIKAELILKFLIPITCTEFQNLKMDSRKQQEERFLYIGLSFEDSAIIILNVYIFFT